MGAVQSKYRSDLQETRESHPVFRNILDRKNIIEIDNDRAQ